jgi:hypothetical protein
MAELKPTLPPAQYFNLMKVSHTPREFFFDFAQFTGEEGQVAALVARLVTSPEHAKSVLAALAENVRLYEGKFGEISVPKAPGAVQ